MTSDNITSHPHADGKPSATDCRCKMDNNLVKQEALEHWLGYKRSADIEKWLLEQGIKYGRSRNGKIVTTQHAIDNSFSTGSTSQPAIEFDFQ